MRAKLAVLLAAGVSVSFLAGLRDAAASGFGRPNQIGARAMGMSGAWAAIADDPLAIYHNPAGLAQLPRTALTIDVEAIYAPRYYDAKNGDPLAKPASCAADPTSNALCPKQEGRVPVPAIPALAFSTRLQGSDHLPSRFAFGAGVFLPYGGAVQFDRAKLANGKPDPAVSGVDDTQLIDVELVPAVAYEVSDALLLGAGIRVGFTIFDVKAFNKPVTADLKSNGLGISFNLGALVRLGKKVQLGVSYQAPMNLEVSGDGTIELPSGTTPVDFAANIHWPQKLMAGVAAKLGKLTISAQIDWTDWSSFQEILLELRNRNDFAFAQNFHDSIGLHYGIQYELSKKLALRGGYTFDGNAVPDRNLERQYLDDDKHLIAVGGSYEVNGRFGIDGAFEMLLPLGARHVPDNAGEVGAGRTDQQNVNPGDHEGKLFTLALTGRVAF